MLKFTGSHDQKSFCILTQNLSDLMIPVFAYIAVVIA